MYAAINVLERATLKSLDNPIASTQKDYYGFNIGMFAAQARLENCALKALNNEEASVQQNEHGDNIGTEITRLLELCDVGYMKMM